MVLGVCVEASGLPEVDDVAPDRISHGKGRTEAVPLVSERDVRDRRYSHEVRELLLLYLLIPVRYLSSVGAIHDGPFHVCLDPRHDPSTFHLRRANYLRKGMPLPEDAAGSGTVHGRIDLQPDIARLLVEEIQAGMAEGGSVVDHAAAMLGDTAVLGVLGWGGTP